MSSTDKRLKKVSVDKNFNNVPIQVEKYGENYSNYRKNYAAAGRHEYEGDFPLYILLEQTFSCNLKCPNCLHGYSSDKKRYDTGVSVMPLELFYKVVLECERRECPSLAMHCCDEPLLVRDIAERIRFAKEHGIMDLMMTTNGQLLTERLAHDICESGLTHILFSIDAATPETYAKVRVNGVFSKVLNSLDYIACWKEKNYSALPIIRASFVCNKNNCFEEEMFIERFKNKVDYIDIQSFYSVDSLNRELAPDGYATLNPQNFICSEPFRKVIVRGNGDVMPCCSVFGYKQIMGNVYKDSIYDIFNSEQMRVLRQQLKEKKFNNICSECITNLYEKK